MTIRVAPGFVDYIELASERITEIGWSVMTGAVQLSARLHTEAMNELLDGICVEPPTPQEKVEIAVRTDLQPLQGETDTPKPVGALYSYQAGYPLEKGGTAIGTGRESRVKMTVGELNKLVLTATGADANWIIRRINHAVFYDNNRTFKDDAIGDITCKPLANGDTQEYVMQNGSTATDNHFLAQAAAIDNSNNPFPLIKAELLEHPENTGVPIVYIPTNLRTAIEALSSFTENLDPDIVPGSGTDTLRRTPRIPFGDEVIGKADGCWIVEWRRLPDSYMWAHCEGDEPFLGWRQDEAPELRGFFVETYTDGGVLLATGMIRYSGFAIRMRTKAVVYYVGAASYVPPTAYDLPWLAL